jgi:F-type H+-transporting ATPase subunit c
VVVTTDHIVTVSAYLGAAFSMGMGAIGTGIGIGVGGAEAARASARQPAAYGQVFKTMLIGQAVTETAAIFALMVAILLLFVGLPGAELSGAAARLGAGFAMGFGAFGPGIGAGLANATACRAVGRRPETSSDVTTVMLIGQSVAQSSAIFALIISLLLALEPSATMDVTVGCKLVGAGLCMGFGAVGPGYGSGVAAMFATYGVACNVRHKQAIMRTMLLGQAVSQSTATYSLVVALLLMYAF